MTKSNFLGGGLLIFSKQKSSEIRKKEQDCLQNKEVKLHISRFDNPVDSLPWTLEAGNFEPHESKFV